MMLLFTLLEHTTAKFLRDKPFPTAMGAPAKMASAAFRHSSTFGSILTFFVSGSAKEYAEDEEEADTGALSPSSESSEKGCMGGGGGRGATGCGIKACCLLLLLLRLLPLLLLLPLRPLGSSSFL